MTLDQLFEGPVIARASAQHEDVIFRVRGGVAGERVSRAHSHLHAGNIASGTYIRHEAEERSERSRSSTARPA
jgi:hypothetical protein